MQRILDQTRQYWDLPSRGTYHEIVSLIISQKISFALSRQIRANLYTLFGTNIFTFEHFHNTSREVLLRAGLSEDQLRIILSIENPVRHSNLKQIHGIGD